MVEQRGRIFVVILDLSSEPAQTIRMGPHGIPHGGRDREKLTQVAKKRIGAGFEIFCGAEFEKVLKCRPDAIGSQAAV